MKGEEPNPTVSEEKIRLCKMFKDSDNPAVSKASPPLVTGRTWRTTAATAEHRGPCAAGGRWSQGSDDERKMPSARAMGYGAIRSELHHNMMSAIS